MWRKLNLSLLSLALATLGRLSDPPGDPLVNCSHTYITEGKTMHCGCHAQFPGFERPDDFSLKWPGFSDTYQLQVTNVTRVDNGTVFPCVMTWAGHKRTRNHTLQVAYGPDSQHTRIRGPKSFITDGKEYLNLTCEATEVNPRPFYTWEGVKCLDEEMSVQEICVLKPKPPLDDGRKIKCTAKSGVDKDKEGISTYRLNLTYPPPKLPEISAVTKSAAVLTSGDELYCRVSGGKPLVKTVNFSCLSDPPLEDQEDTMTGSTVNSKVIIRSFEKSSYNMVCVCSAIWEPREDFYLANSTVVVSVGIHQQDDPMYSLTTFHIGIAVAIPAVLLSFIIAVIIAVVHTKKRRTRKGFSKGTDECCQQSRTHCQTPRISWEIYEEVDIPRQRVRCINAINAGNSSEAHPAILNTKIKLCGAKPFRLQAGKMSHRTRDMQSSSAGLDVQEGVEGFPSLAVGLSEKTNLPPVDEQELYSEIDLPGQESLLALSKTYSSLQTCSRDVPNDSSASCSQVAIWFQAQQTGASEEVCEAYSTLQHR